MKKIFKILTTITSFLLYLIFILISPIITLLVGLIWWIRMVFNGRHNEILTSPINILPTINTSGCVDVLGLQVMIFKKDPADD